MCSNYQKALFIATGDPEFQSIIECVRAVLFVGTPNREDEDQSYGEILANVGKFTGPRYGAKSFWNSLQDNSEAFGELTSAWHLLPTIPVYSFSEMKPIDGLSRVVSFLVTITTTIHHIDSSLLARQQALSYPWNRERVSHPSRCNSSRTEFFVYSAQSGLPESVRNLESIDAQRELASEVSNIRGTGRAGFPAVSQDV